MEIIFDSILISIEIVFLFISFFILGIFFRKTFLQKKTGLEDIIETNILGFFFNFLFLSIVNIFFPIYSWFIIIILICFVYSFKEILSFIKKIKYQNNCSLLVFSLLVILPFLLWVSNLGLKELRYEPIYHIQKIRWAQEYPLTPGLANLSLWFGFDSSFFLQIAFFDQIQFVTKIFRSFSGYLLTLGFLYFFAIPVYKFFKNIKPELSDIIKIFFTPILVNHCFYLHPGLGTDLPTIIFGSIVSVELFRLIFEKKNNLSFLLICLCLGFSSKLSFLPTAFLTLFSLLYYYGFRFFIHRYEKKIIFLLVILGFTLQLLRNVVLTGYPLYPFKHFSISLKWKVDELEVEKIAKDIKSYATGTSAGNYNIHSEDFKKRKKEWIKQRLFLQHRRIETLYPILLGLIGIAYILIRRLASIKELAIFLLPAIGQIAMWYFIAPAGRFGVWGFWWVGSGLICYLVKDIFSKKYLPIFSAIIVLFSFSIHVIDSLGQKKNILVSSPLSQKNRVPNSFVTKTSTSLLINTPYNNKPCDDCSIPCSMAPKDNLKLIDGVRIKSGFYLQ